jgi:hypothetical protein
MRPGSPSCEETGMMLAMVDAPGSTGAPLAATATSPRHVDPRHAADLLRDELTALDEGDVAGARAVLDALLMLVAS